jgi:16S rRNA (cytosine1407-C5)-methyltransferase
MPLAEDLLRAQGFVFEPDPFFPPARRLISGPLPLGSSLAAVFGHIYIQDRSSMLPPLALAPRAGDSALDMCASPGGKTGILAQLAGPDGFVLANEPSAARLFTLRRNLHVQNLFSCATCAYPGERLPLPPAPDARAAAADAPPGAGWERILLDPPCSGWGTAEKHPRVLRLWKGDKVKPLIALQRALLAEAARLLRPGGRLVYSTCTTNVEENEAQARFAREELGLLPLPLDAPPGFSLRDPQLPGCEGVWRVEGGRDGQGFFVCLLMKAPSGPAGDGSRPAGAFPEGPFPGGLPRREKRDRPGMRAQGAPVGDVSAGPYTDMRLLPPGDLAVFNSVLHFLPKGGRALPERGFAWKGFPLGRLGPRARLNPHLRGLMPAAESVRRQGLPCLDLEDPAPILALLAGRSLGVTAASPEIGLYFRGLPLCRLTVKGARAMLPPP